MTAEFNVTIPGAEIIKSLTDLETQVRDLANERAIDKVLIHAHTDVIADLIDRVDRLTDFVNGKIDHAPNYPANDPEPPVDTSWHLHDARFGGLIQEGKIPDHPTGTERVVVMFRDGFIYRSTAAFAHIWYENGDSTIIAWRYAKEGE